MTIVQELSYLGGGLRSLSALFVICDYIVIDSEIFILFSLEF